MNTHKKLIFAFICLLSFIPAMGLAQAFSPVAPCISEPYDYSYQDERLSIAIDKVEQQDLAYFVVDVQVSEPTVLQAGLSRDKPNGGSQAVSTIASRNGAVLAINADNYGFHEYGTIIRNGQLIRAKATTRNMLVVDANGDMSIRVDRKKEKPSELGKKMIELGVWQTFEFGPELVRDGQAVTFSESFDVISTSDSRREPRTAIGQIGPLHYLIIVADGRSEGYSLGMTLPELQQLFVSYGAKTALNLDGGGSTELYFNGEIISRPSGGVERAVSDVIMFK
ncbi:MAG: phosphodiester glycosidase family protein [Clostridia bacterium]